MIKSNKSQTLSVVRYYEAPLDIENKFANHRKWKTNLGQNDWQTVMWTIAPPPPALTGRGLINWDIISL